MKVRELKELISQKMPEGTDRSVAMVRFTQPVECYDCEWEETVEVGQDFDRYHEDTLHNVTVPVYFDIEDWYATYNVSDVIDAQKAVIVVDTTWTGKTGSMSLADFMLKLDAIQEDKDVTWTAGGAVSGNLADFAAFDFVGNPETKRKYPFYGNARGDVKYQAALTVGTDDVDEDPPESAIEQYADEHEDSLREQAYERASAYEDDPRGGDYDEPDWED